MKKCIKCEIVFHSDYRTHCLYCDSFLITIASDEVFRLEAQTSVLEEAIKAQGPVSHDRMEYIVASYFRSKSLSFRYAFCRSEYFMGKGFKRFFIQPLDLSFLIRIPWFFINLIDSLFCRVTYGGFCEKCSWKISGSHSPQECEYHQEYSKILSEILNGKITKSEERFGAVAAEKIRQGKRSAYHDLCARKKGVEIFFDIVVIISSMGVIIYGLVRMAMPLLDRVLHLSDVEYL